MSADVVLTRCENYEYDRVKKAVTNTMEQLGGVEKYFKPGEKVLLKVNLLTKKKPEEATTTHPSVVRAIAEIFLEYGLKVYIGDSPGGPFSASYVEPIYKMSGIEEVSITTGAELNRTYGSFEKKNPDGYVLKKILLTDMLNDVDKVVSVSKLKTHGMMTFTGAVKNMFGTIPGVIKAEYHLNMPEKDDFANALIDICLCVNPVLSFMDGITAMEGAGPSAGEPRDLGVLLASPSPFHLDKAALGIISLPFNYVPVIQQAIKRNIVSDGFDDINFLGEPIGAFVVTDFKIPLEADLNPFRKGLMSAFWPALSALLKSKPVITNSQCIGCGICKDNCPAKTIEITEKKAQINLSKCISCFCCQELCPKKAIEIKRPFLLKAITKR